MQVQHANPTTCGVSTGLNWTLPSEPASIHSSLLFPMDNVYCIAAIPSMSMQFIQFSILTFLPNTLPVLGRNISSLIINPGGKKGWWHMAQRYAAWIRESRERFSWVREAGKQGLRKDRFDFFLAHVLFYWWTPSMWMVLNHRWEWEIEKDKSKGESRWQTLGA